MQTKTIDEKNEQLIEDVIDQIRMCFDPEIPVNIYDLGLIYDVLPDAENKTVHIKMTLTSPNCPSIEELPQDVIDRVETVKEIEKCHLELVWDPPFTTEMMSDEAKLALGLL